MKQTNYLKIAACAAASIMLIGCAAGTRYSRSTGEYIDDKATASRVKSALHDDSLVKSAEINVESFRGNVHLTGFVDHPVQKERASMLTRNVKGVNWFKNDIVVKGNLPSGMATSQQISEPSGSSNAAGRNQSSRPMAAPSGSSQGANWEHGSINAYDPAATISAQPSRSVQSPDSTRSTPPERGAAGLLSNDAAGSNNDLVQRVSTQLRSDNSAAAQNVQVENAGNGKITLRGMVSSQDEKNSIESKAKAIPGVNDVDNQIEVQNK